MASIAVRAELPRRVLCGARTGLNWAKIAAILAIGYLCFGRSFAYLGLPWFSIYIGEITLAAFLLFGPKTNQGRWLQIAQRARQLKRLEWLLILLLLYGGFEAVRGFLAGHSAFVAARDAAFNYYPLYLFAGIWAGLADRNLLRKMVRALAWCNGCYGVAYVLLLNRFPWTMPGTSAAASTVLLFGQPTGSAIALLGLIAFESRPRRVWHLLALNTFVLLAVQVRAEWLGFAVGLALFAVLTKRAKYLGVGAGLLILLLGVMYLAKVNLPSPQTRGGRISVDYLIARAVAPVNRDLADRMAPSKAVRGFEGTAHWRLVWWASIWNAVHANSARALFGFGYGFPIGDLNPLIPSGQFIQTPHSDFFYALGFSGWVGVILFVLVQAEVGRLLFRSYSRTGQPFGLAFWSMILAASFFGEIFEGPYGAIPFYLLVGMALAPALLSRGRNETGQNGQAVRRPATAETV